MKLALFFLLSVAVHATAFLVPISFNGRSSDQAITVTILPLEPGFESSGGSGSARAAGNRALSKSSVKAPVLVRPGAAPRTATPIAHEKIPGENLSVVTDNDITALAEFSPVGIPSRTGETSASGNGSGGNDSGSAGIGAGSGNGSGSGQGSGAGQAGANITQVRYRDTPQPQYPDSARREGKEGRVLLRVLVDADGRTKSVEINTSSGDDTLDRAATEALKKWRFVPARAGTKPIETWVKVPIEFQLSNAKQ
jgi:TonB family protein